MQLSVTNLIEKDPVFANPGHVAKNVVNLNNDLHFHSVDAPNISLCHDFRERRIIRIAYSLGSFDSCKGGAHPKHWAIEISNDRSIWTELDKRDDNGKPNRCQVTMSFDISRQEECRQTLIRKTGKNHSESSILSSGVRDLWITSRVETAR